MLVKDLPLFLDVDILKDNKLITINVQTRDFNQCEDLKISDFYSNIWYRPKKAVKKIPYKNIIEYKKAIKLSIKKNMLASVLSIYYIDSTEKKIFI